jgi:hypothetical protein
MVPPLNRFTSAEILQAMGSGHHWPLGVLAMLIGVVFFVVGAATTATLLTNNAGEVRSPVPASKIANLVHKV